jgi:hypothetical protein
MFEKQRHDFGVVARGADVSYRFVVTNIYKDPVHISNVRTSCGCTAATPSKTSLASREKAFIEVKMDTRKFVRQKDSNLIVTFDAPLYAEVTLPISAYIRTDVVLTPGGASFGPVDHGAEHERKIDVAYAGRPNWTIRDARTDSPHLEAQVVETSRTSAGANYQLVIRLKSTAPLGAFRQQVTLVTDDEGNPQVPVLVEGRVEADITVTPDPVALGTVPVGGQMRSNIVVRGKKPFAIEKIECESAGSAFSVRLPKDEKAVHVLPLTFTAPDAPGAVNEVFTVTIAGRPEPVQFRAYGTIAPGTAN